MTSHDQFDRASEGDTFLLKIVMFRERKKYVRFVCVKNKLAHGDQSVKKACTSISHDEALNSGRD